MAMQNTNEFGVQIDTYGAHGEGEGDAEGDGEMRYIKAIPPGPDGAGLVKPSQGKPKRGKRNSSSLSLCSLTPPRRPLFLSRWCFNGRVGTMVVTINHIIIILSRGLTSKPGEKPSDV